MADIFISHAAKDVRLVEAIVQLIEGGIGIRSSQIFCSSMEELGVPPGADFKTHIKERLGEAKVVIAVVSPQYYNSAFCMCELGATWALTKVFMPILVPPINYSDLRGSLFGSQSLPVGEGDKLDTMHSEIVKLAAMPEKVARWNSRKKQFLDQLPAILQNLLPVRTLSEQEANQLRVELDEYKDEFEKADVQIAVLKRQVAELENVKDKEIVDTIKRKYSTAWDTFNELIKSAGKQNSELPSVVREALYHRLRQEEFVPNWDLWGDQPTNAEEQGYLIHGDPEFSVNDAHPKVKRAIHALGDLDKFLEKPPENFETDYEKRYDDVVSIRNRTFWNRHDLF